MREVILRILMVCGALLVGACESVPKQAEMAADPESDAVILPFAEPEKKLSELDAELIYSTLLGEIARQRGDMALAYDSYLQATIRSGDAKLAERAVRLAIYLKRNDQALVAVNHWIELAPNDLTARQLGAYLHLEVDNEEAAFEHLKAVVLISQAQRSDGFLHALSALTKSTFPEKAIGLMRRLAAEYPDNADAAYAVALMPSITKQWDQAEREAQILVDRFPDLEKGYVLQSRVYVSKKDKPKARAVLEEAVSDYPDSEMLRAALGRLLIDLKESELAYRQFLKQRGINPEPPEIHLTLGVLALQMERYAEAREHLRDAFERDSKSNDAAYYLGRVEEIEKNHTEAVKWFKRVGKGDLHYEAQVRMARLQAVEGGLGEARDTLQALRIRFPKHSVDLYLVEADMLRQHADSDTVTALYAQGLSAHPGNADLLYARALYAATQGWVDVLEQDLMAILEQEPQHADALNALGYTLADQTDRYQEALGYIEQALALKPDAPAVLDSMGWVQYRLGNYAEALEYLRRAIDMLQDAEIAAHLGEVLWVTGEREEARGVWDKALEQNPDNEYLLKTLKRLDP
ncbi:MAG: tetratricopeptide repeat protein [Chromatiales bacterium]|nr:tetratricopeptide repeat protein [Chromatiales bacterium]